MSVPPTKILMLDFPPCELPEFMTALCSALPGSMWSSQVMHQHKCPLSGGRGVPDDSCTCQVAAMVIVKRLQPATTAGWNGAGGRTG